MNTNTVDVYIYLNSRDKSVPAGKVVDLINSETGVQKTVVNPRIGKLIAVSYNPGETSGHTLVKTVRRNGWQACLVGM